MLRNRYTTALCIVISVAMVAIAVLFAGGEALGLTSAPAALPYVTSLFATDRVHTLDIVADESDWQDMLDNASAKEYIPCSVVIDGSAVKNVGIRPKGNSTLSTMVRSESDRYSFKLEFDHYSTGQTYQGLDKIALNNIAQDSTYLKDYLSYQMMNWFGADSPLCSFIDITVNGESWGLYLAVEAVEESFAQRLYGNDFGRIYKPESMGMGGGRGGERNGEMPMPGNWDGKLRAGEDDPNGRQPPEGFDPQAGDVLPEPVATDGGLNAPPAEADLAAPPDAQNTPPTNGAGPAAPQGERPGGGRGMAGEMPPDTAAPNGQNPRPANEATPAAPQGDNPLPETAVTGDQNAPSAAADPAAPQGDGTLPETAATGDQNTTPPETVPAAPQDGQDAPQRNGAGPGAFPGGGGPGGFGRSDATSLVYTDDAHDSYSSIFENAVFDSTDADKDRLIDILRQLSEGENLDEIIDIDEVLRYFVVHNYLLNFDSYTGTMVHNYYLREQDGKLSMIAWDYNLAFGAFAQGGGPGGSRDGADGSDNATQMVNYPIDTPIHGGSLEDRPLLGQLLANETYLTQYHALFDEFIAGFFESGEFLNLFDQAVSLISPYVEKDPTAFCTYEEFQTGSSTLREFCQLRAESIRGQLRGEVPATSEGQAADSSGLVDASHIQMSVMGSMSSLFGGGREGGFGGGDAPEQEGEGFPADRGQFPGQFPADGEAVAEEGDQPARNQWPGGGGDFGAPPEQSGASLGDWLPLVIGSAALLLVGLFAARRCRVWR